MADDSHACECSTDSSRRGGELGFPRRFRVDTGD